MPAEDLSWFERRGVDSSPYGHRRHEEATWAEFTARGKERVRKALSSSLDAFPDVRVFRRRRIRRFRSRVALAWPGGAWRRRPPLASEVSEFMRLTMWDAGQTVPPPRPFRGACRRATLPRTLRGSRRVPRRLRSRPTRRDGSLDGARAPGDSHVCLGVDPEQSRVRGPADAQ